MKKIFLLCLIPLLFGTTHAMGPKAPEGVSLLLVPARPAMIQLGLDMAEQQHALLMSYAPDTDPGELYLHLWDGEKWLRVSAARYAAGSFIKNPASRLLVIGDESELTATLIEQALDWSPEVLHLGSQDVTELINQMGRLYGFKRADWEWIANRYDLELENLNQDRTQESWYDANKASNLPPSEKPWKKSGASGEFQTPETSLSPVMPPVTEEQEGAAVEMPVELESIPVEEPIMEDDDLKVSPRLNQTSVDYKLEME